MVIVKSSGTRYMVTFFNEDSFVMLNEWLQTILLILNEPQNINISSDISGCEHYMF
jgi:hypothetical protein